MSKVLLFGAAAPLLWIGSALALPLSPAPAAPGLVSEARTLCDASGRCCNTGDGRCFYRVPPQAYYYSRPRPYAERPPYGYPGQYYERRWDRY